MNLNRVGNKSYAEKKPGCLPGTSTRGKSGKVEQSWLKCLKKLQKEMDRGSINLEDIPVLEIADCIKNGRPIHLKFSKSAILGGGAYMEVNGVRIRGNNGKSLRLHGGSRAKVKTEERDGLVAFGKKIMQQASRNAKTGDQATKELGDDAPIAPTVREVNYELRYIEIPGLSEIQASIDALIPNAPKSASRAKKREVAEKKNDAFVELLDKKIAKTKNALAGAEEGISRPEERAKLKRVGKGIITQLEVFRAQARGKTNFN